MTNHPPRVAVRRRTESVAPTAPPAPPAPAVETAPSFTAPAPVVEVEADVQAAPSFAAAPPATTTSPALTSVPTGSGTVAGEVREPANHLGLTPVERLDPTGGWPLTEAASACPDKDLSTPRRLDPYYDGLWFHSGASAKWISRDLARRQTTAGLGRLPKPLGAAEKDAVERMAASRDINDRVSMLGVLHAWRTATAEQIATFAGSSALAPTLSKSTAAAFDAGVIDFGVTTVGLDGTSGLAARDVLIRPSTTSAFERHIAPRLTYAEWLGVTGGQEWAAGGYTDRHNMLSTELGLRLAEYADAGTVLGERFASFDYLAGSGAGLAPIDSHRLADLVYVRPDGLRIAIEVTTTFSAGLFKKADEWARLMASRSLAETGLMVLFLVAPAPEPGTEAKATRVRSKTYEAVHTAVRNHPGISADPTAARMAVATWAEWFPSRHHATDAFPVLRADRPVGDRSRPWVSADLADPAMVGFDPADPETARAVMSGAAMLGQTPYWLRHPAPGQSPLDVSRLLLDGVGWDAAPTPTPTRAERIKGDGRPLGAGVGAVPDASVPPRLRGLAGS